jgi:hypothetical protein
MCDHVCPPAPPLPRVLPRRSRGYIGRRPRYDHRSPCRLQGRGHGCGKARPCGRNDGTAADRRCRSLTGRPAATTSSLALRAIRSTATAPWSAAGATPTRALYRWANGLRACHELAMLAPIMWQLSLSVVQPAGPGLSAGAFLYPHERRSCFQSCPCSLEGVSLGLGLRGGKRRGTWL